MSRVELCWTSCNVPYHGPSTWQGFQHAFDGLGNFTPIQYCIFWAPVARDRKTISSVDIRGHACSSEQVALASHYRIGVVPFVPTRKTVAQHTSASWKSETTQSLPLCRLHTPRDRNAIPLAGTQQPGWPGTRVETVVGYSQVNGEESRPYLTETMEIWNGI